MIAKKRILVFDYAKYFSVLSALVTEGKIQKYSIIADEIKKYDQEEVEVDLDHNPKYFLRNYPNITLNRSFISEKVVDDID